MRSHHRMPLPPRRRLAVAAACSLLAAALAAGLVLAAGGGDMTPAAARPGAAAQGVAPARGGAAGAPVRAAAAPAVSAAPARLSVSGALPAWRAPGGRLVVEGHAGPRARVTLLVAGRRSGVTTSGLKGRFVVEGRVPQRAGRVAVAVVSGGQRLAAGSLRIRPIDLAAVGDVTFGGGVGRAIEQKGMRYPWLKVGPELRAADIATANLETAVSTRGTPEPGKLFHFRGPAAAVTAAVRTGGIDVFTLANNHSRDYGAVALLDSVRAVRKAGALAVGAGADLAKARAAGFVDRGGLRIAFLGYNDVPPWSFTAAAGYAGTAPAVPADIARDVRVARTRADLVVVWFHWGWELQPAQNGRQEELARAALDAGAKLVLGAHSHALLPLGLPQPGRLVAWSLGNFVFTPRSEVTGRTAVLHVALGASGVLGQRLRGVRIVGEQPRWEPGASWLEPGGANAKPPVVPDVVPISNAQAELEQAQRAAAERAAATATAGPAKAGPATAPAAG